MARYLDPKNDVPFKRIFGEHPNLLISFLNALMPFEEGRIIESIEYLSPESLRETPLGKNSTVDVRCKDNFNRQFIVEMQMYWTNYFTNRMVFNASRAYVRQIGKSGNWKFLQPVYCLAILNDYIEPKDESTSFYHYYRSVNLENTNDIVEGLEYVLVELPKFKPETFSNRKMAALWLRFLREVGEEITEIDKELSENKDIRAAMDLCEEGAFTPAELKAYEDHWDNVRTEVANTIEFTEKGKAEGKAEGIIEGKAEGKAEGIIEGIIKGKAEGIIEGIIKERIRMIIDGKNAGLPIDIIATISKSTPEEVIEILKQQNQYDA